MIRAIILDFYGVLYVPAGSQLVRNEALLAGVQRFRSECKIGLLSNLNPGAIDEYFSKDEQATLFDVVVVSGGVGMAKPDPAIFTYICDQLGVEPAQAVMIDDIEDNCAGARSAGLLAIRYDSLSQTQAAMQELLE